MTTTRTTTRATTLALLLALGAVTFTGCSAIGDTLNNERAMTFSSATEVESGWEKTAPWLPADATDIRIRESTTGDPAVLRAATSAELDPSACVVTERQSAPTFTDTWTPDAYVTDIWACGDWAVIPTDDGWFGWTPIDPDEKAASLLIDSALIDESAP